MDTKTQIQRRFVKSAERTEKNQPMTLKVTWMRGREGTYNYYTANSERNEVSVNWVSLKLSL